MGFFGKKLQQFKKERKEKVGYKRLVAQRVKVAERQAYAVEAEKQARLRAERIAKERFNRPSFGQRLASKLAPQQAQRKQAVMRTTRAITKSVKRKTTRRKARRRKARRKPTVKVIRRTMYVNKPQARQPLSLKDWI